MKRFLALTCLAALAVACSNPAGPDKAAAPAAIPTAGADGTASSKAITIERIRLRKVGGDDYMTSLAGGQIIDVPLDTNLDIWAEIRRLESDSARLVVDWGNGNKDFSNCGSCRLENVYKDAGKYTVTITLIDLNAPTDSSILTTFTVTLNVIDFSVAPLTCTSVSTDFTPFTLFSAPPLNGTGFSILGNGRVTFELLAFTLFSGKAFSPNGDMTIEFESDKNFASLAFHTPNILVPGRFYAPTMPVSFQAFNEAGQTVLSGQQTGSIAGPGIGLLQTVEDTLVISGATFRKIVISSDYGALRLYVDNLEASCR